jgi:hypothetical protein
VREHTEAEVAIAIPRLDLRERILERRELLKVEHLGLGCRCTVGPLVHRCAMVSVLGAPLGANPQSTVGGAGERLAGLPARNPGGTPAAFRRVLALAPQPRPLMRDFRGQRWTADLH